MKDKDLIKYWKLVGKYYGYPPCCIKEFCEADEDRKLTDFQKAITNLRFGFIPCKICAEKVVNGEDFNLVSMINRKRFCTLPFPIADDNLDDFLESRS